MDANTITAVVGLALTSGTGLISVTLYAVNTRAIAQRAEHKARNIEQGLGVYARKETIGPQLVTINQALQRIEARQDALMNKLLGGGA